MPHCGLLEGLWTCSHLADTVNSTTLLKHVYITSLSEGHGAEPQSVSMSERQRESCSETAKSNPSVPARLQMMHPLVTIAFSIDQ